MVIRRRPICVLVSGGLDSAALLEQLQRRGHSVLPLYVRCGLRWEAAELYWLHRWLRALGRTGIHPLMVIDLPMTSLYGAHWSLTGRRVPSASSADAAVYLPGRNAVLLTAAAIACARRGISTIAIGTLTGNPFGDATPAFFASMARVLTHALRRPIRIVAPLQQMRKAELLRRMDPCLASLTFSCLRPRGRRPCGRCNKCAERRRALRSAGR